MLHIVSTQCSLTRLCFSRVTRPCIDLVQLLCFLCGVVSYPKQIPPGKSWSCPAFLHTIQMFPWGKGGRDGRREAHCTSTVARTNWTKQHSLMFCRAAYLMSPRGDFAFLKLLLMRLIILSLASIISPGNVTCISCLTGWPS